MPFVAGPLGVDGTFGFAAMPSSLDLVRRPIWRGKTVWQLSSRKPMNAEIEKANDLAVTLRGLTGRWKHYVMRKNCVKPGTRMFLLLR